MSKDINSNDINPIIRLDYPDPEVIRVGDTYYMVSTTMHFMPGCEILRSYDLLNWEHVTYVYDTLDSTKEQTLSGDENIYGKGMWAASLRYHKGVFYICFVANDTRKTYLYTSCDIMGPWKKSNIDGFYHDCSLLFDEDKVYIVYGNKDVHLTQLRPDLTGPLEGGLNRLIVSDKDNPVLGYEGAHFYKINGKYYLFFIHSLADRWRRVEACFVSDSLNGEFVGRDVLNDDIGYCNQGIAQGGIVDTPDGTWYGILFQDRGAVGRIPVLMPVSFEDDFPIFGENGRIPKDFEINSSRPEYQYRPLVQSDDFKGSIEVNGKEEYGCFGMKSTWQFNHEPDLSLVHCDREKGIFRVRTGKLCTNLTQAKNTLTQRMLYPGCEGEITVNAEGLKDGDFAGICAFQGLYGMVALTKRNGATYIVMKNRETDDTYLQGLQSDVSVEKEVEAVLVESSIFRLKVKVDFTEMKDEAEFFYFIGDEWKKIGITHKLYFKLDHFTGCRFGLFVYSTIEAGGFAEFSDFTYRYNEK
jgi:beta-xylosidase